MVCRDARCQWFVAPEFLCSNPKLMGFGGNALGSLVLQSPVDGKPMLLTPEESITIQVSLSIFHPYLTD